MIKKIEGEVFADPKAHRPKTGHTNCGRAAEPGQLQLQDGVGSSCAAYRRSTSEELADQQPFVTQRAPDQQSGFGPQRPVRSYTEFESETHSIRYKHAASFEAHPQYAMEPIDNPSDVKSLSPGSPRSTTSLIEGYRGSSKSIKSLKTSNINYIYELFCIPEENEEYYAHTRRSVLKGIINFSKWRVSKDASADRLIFFIPAFGPEGLIAVRKLCDPLGEGGGISLVESAVPGGIADIPMPFKQGMFDRDVVFVLRSPVSATLMQLGDTDAYAMDTPSATLGSPEALRHLVALGAITARRRPKGTLVIIDPEGALQAQGAMYLKRFFAEVIEAPDVAKGDFNRWIMDQITNDEPSARLKSSLLRMARKRGSARREWPRPLPPEPEPDPFSMAGVQTNEYGFGDLSAIALSPGGGVDWVVPGVAAAGTVTDLIGEPKAGKSTFLLEASRAVIEGRDFMGRACAPGAVVYVSEQTASSMKATATRMGWDTDGLHLMTVDVHGTLGFDEIVRRVTEQVRKVEARLVVIDTLPAVAGISGDLVSPGPVMRAFRTIRRVCALGAAVVVTRHTTKRASGDEKTSVVTAGMGSQAYAGEADHLVLYTRAGSSESSLRKVVTMGRLSGGETRYVEWTGQAVVEHGGDAGGEDDDHAPAASGVRESLDDIVLAVLAQSSDGALGVDDIITRVNREEAGKVKDSSLRRSLKRLVKSGEVKVDKRGRKHLFSTQPVKPISSSSPAQAGDDEK